MASIVLNGATSGGTTLTPTDAVTVTLTLPSTTGTLALAGSGGFSQAQIFTASGSFTVPSSGKFKVTIIGGGAGGTSSGYPTNPSATGGGAGGSVIKWFTGATSGATATVTIGAGGSADNAGGASSFVLSGFTTLTSNGGSTGSTFSSAGGAGGNGGSATGGDINIAGQGGSRSSGDNTNYASLDGSRGGSSILGSGGQTAYNATGSVGTGYGSGGQGGGGSAVRTGGAGTGGICIVEY